jgi:Fe-S-cluster containining protein
MNNLDEWFSRIRKTYNSEMQCGKGCTACCHGLFDISIADASDVARGFKHLDPGRQAEVLVKAEALQRGIRAIASKTGEPTLFDVDDPQIDEIVESANHPACPFLGAGGDCSIYDYRPMACRLEGVPMVDVNDGLFGDWCELNFKNGVAKSALADLAQDYDRIAQSQEARSAVEAERAGLSDSLAVTFIPSVIVESDFWNRGR